MNAAPQVPRLSCCRPTRNFTPRRPASRTRRSPARTHRQALPLRTRTSRRSHPQEAQAAAQGSHGRHHATPSAGHRTRSTAIAARASPAARPLRIRSVDALRSRRAAVHRRRLADLALVVGCCVGWSLALPFVALGAFFVFFFRDPERDRRPTTRQRRAVAGRRPRARRRRRRSPTPRRRARGSRSASSCRRWTCTSTACPCRAASRA